MAVYENTGHFDLDIASSGGGWTGTYAGLVRQAAADILSDGAPFGPVEVTTDDETFVGTLTAIDLSDGSLSFEGRPHRVSVDDITRFRA
jgi:hypothetical protein